MDGVGYLYNETNATQKGKTSNLTLLKYLLSIHTCASVTINTVDISNEVAQESMTNSI